MNPVHCLRFNIILKSNVSVEPTLSTRTQNLKWLLFRFRCRQMRTSKSNAVGWLWTTKWTWE